MKKRLTGKPASIVILAVLVIISLADIILRGVLLRGASLDIANAGEPIIAALFSLMLIIFAAMGKDRLFYILCGGFLGYFVLNELFSIPGMVANLVDSLSAGAGHYAYPIAVSFHLLSMIGIVAIGALLVEYMNDGSIYNKTFNVVCIITVLMITNAIGACIFSTVVEEGVPVILAVINNLSRLTTVFLFVTYAYDTAKKQLAKTKL